VANHQYLLRGKTLEYRGLIHYVDGSKVGDLTVNVYGWAI
jgi:hypothetical protein